MKVYDVFISYRRIDGETAECLYEQLTRNGFVVFWDQESLENGLFGEDIEVAIKNCKHFLLLMNESTLERCFSDPDDWVLQEISQAINSKKNIVPLFIGSCNQFPDRLPERISKLAAYNGITGFDPNDRNSIHQLVTKFMHNYDVFSKKTDYEIDGDRLVKCIHPTINMTIPSGIHEICSEAFMDCTTIQELHFNDDLEVIGEGAFQRCRNLEYLDLPSHLKRIGRRAFYRCHKLKSINLSSSIETIEEQAFAFCNSLREVKLDKALISIDPTAFEECTRLRSISVEKNNPLFCSVDGILYDKGMERVVKFPAAKKGNYTLPESVKIIGKYSFANSNISTIEFNSTIQSIERYAFLDSVIKKIVYPFDTKPTSVDKLSFNGCELLVNNPFEIAREEDTDEYAGIKDRLILFEYIIVKTSFESEEEAYNMTKMLLERNLIVSGQIKEHRAIYKWNGEISDENEIELLCFTRGILYNKVEEYIKEHHSYDCPEILCIPIINTSVSFGKWIDDGTRYGEKK